MTAPRARAQRHSLRRWQDKGWRNVLWGEHPTDCHRHSAITGPHFPQALHIYRDRLFYSSELSRVDAGENRL